MTMLKLQLWLKSLGYSSEVLGPDLIRIEGHGPKTLTAAKSFLRQLLLKKLGSEKIDMVVELFGE